MILISPCIALLLDREFNYSQKCLEVPIREKLDSQNICRIQYRGRAPVSNRFPSVCDRPTSTQPHIFQSGIPSRNNPTYTLLFTMSVDPHVGLFCDDAPLCKCKAGLNLGSHSLELFFSCYNVNSLQVNTQHVFVTNI